MGKQSSTKSLFHKHHRVAAPRADGKTASSAFNELLDRMEAQLKADAGQRQAAREAAKAADAAVFAAARARKAS